MVMSHGNRSASLLEESLSLSHPSRVDLVTFFPQKFMGKSIPLLDNGQGRFSPVQKLSKRNAIVEICSILY